MARASTAVPGAARTGAASSTSASPQSFPRRLSGQDPPHVQFAPELCDNRAMRLLALVAAACAACGTPDADAGLTVSTLNASNDSLTLRVSPLTAVADGRHYVTFTATVRSAAGAPE